MRAILLARWTLGGKGGWKALARCRHDFLEFFGRPFSESFICWYWYQVCTSSLWRKRKERRRAEVQPWASRRRDDSTKRGFVFERRRSRGELPGPPSVIRPSTPFALWAKSSDPPLTLRTPLPSRDRRILHGSATRPPSSPGLRSHTALPLELWAPLSDLVSLRPRPRPGRPCSAGRPSPRSAPIERSSSVKVAEVERW